MAATGDIILNLGDFAEFLPTDLGKFFLLLKAAGVLLLIYLIYTIIISIINIRRARRLKRVEKKVDLLLKKFNLEYKKGKNKK